MCGVGGGGLSKNRYGTKKTISSPTLLLGVRSLKNQKKNRRTTKETVVRRLGGAVFQKSIKNLGEPGHDVWGGGLFRNKETDQQTNARRLGGAAFHRIDKTGKPIPKPASGVLGAVFQKSVQESNPIPNSTCGVGRGGGGWLTVKNR